MLTPNKTQAVAPTYLRAEKEEQKNGSLHFTLNSQRGTSFSTAFSDTFQKGDDILCIASLARRQTLTNYFSMAPLIEL